MCCKMRSAALFNYSIVGVIVDVWRWVLEEVPGGLIAQVAGEWDVGDWHLLLNGRLLVNRAVELRYPGCRYWVGL